MAVGAVVVGTGFGARVHVPALRRAGFEVAALVGRDPDRTARRAARLEIPRWSTSLHQALQTPGVDLVAIVTPPGTHADLALEAASAGRHFLCEKPFTLDEGQARAVRDAAITNGVVAVVGHEFRFASDRAAIALALQRGQIGEPRLITLVSMIPLVADPGAAVPEWWFDPARGGGWLGASGSHVVDQVRSWLGDYAEVSASLALVSDRAVGAEDTFTVRFSLVNGVHGVMHQSAGSWGPSLGLSRISGTHGSLWSDGADAWISNAGGQHRLDVPGDVRPADPPAQNDDRRHRFTHMELPAYTRLYEVVADMLASRDPRWPVPVATADDGVAEMLVLDAIRESARAGGARTAVTPA